MKKYKLRMWVKVVLTVLVAIISSVIYLKVGTFGELAQTDRSYLLICIGSWFWLLVGQMIMLSVIWES